MNDEIIIPPPEDVEAEYREGTRDGISRIGEIALAATAASITESAITSFITRTQAFINSWLRTGIDASGVFNRANSGAGYRVIRSAILSTERNHRTRLISEYNRVFGQNISGSITRARFTRLLDQRIAQNLLLVTDVTNQQLLLIERAIRDAFVTPELGGQVLKDRIRDIQNKGINRAALIADNEIGNLHAQLQIQRFQQLGVNEYVWRTSGDERVRQRHVALNGNVYVVGDPTDAEGGAPPGGPIRCRCVAIPRFVVPDAN